MMQSTSQPDAERRIRPRWLVLTTLAIAVVITGVQLDGLLSDRSTATALKRVEDVFMLISQRYVEKPIPMR